MSWRYQFQLPDGVKPDDPEAAELLAKIKALKPLPAKLTVREQLATALFRAFHYKVNGHEPPDLTGCDPSALGSYLAEADAAVEFFRQMLRDADDEVRSGHPVSRDGYVRNAAVTELANNLLERLSK